MEYGYFDDAAREYVITRPDTPSPWINYLGSEAFFTLLSNTGGGYSFYRDARLLRLTRYRYNGVPTGLTHCSETGCLREQLGVPSGQRHEICRGLHAEQNAIIQAARYGINIAGATIYVNTQPCVVCAKMLINAGITEIVYQNPYPDELSQELLAESGILVREYTGE